MDPRSGQERPRRPQERPGRPPERPKSRQERPKRTQEPPKLGFRAALTAHLSPKSFPEASRRQFWALPGTIFHSPETNIKPLFHFPDSTTGALCSIYSTCGGPRRPLLNVAIRAFGSTPCVPLSPHDTCLHSLRFYHRPEHRLRRSPLQSTVGVPSGTTLHAHPELRKVALLSPDKEGPFRVEID